MKNVAKACVWRRGCVQYFFEVSDKVEFSSPLENEMAGEHHRPFHFCNDRLFFE